jgi:hypothetical protein
MDLNTLLEYICLLYRSSKEDGELDKTSLDILEHFAWKESASSYQIYSDLKSTVLKKAYKNVNKWVNALLSSGLIHETEINDVDNKHKANYYRLSEYGIYQLFLNKLNSMLVNQSDVRRSKELSSNASVFFRNYNECLLFEIFLYPYFRKDTLFAVGDHLLWDLYRYLSTCCHNIERYLKYSKITDIPLVEKVFSWNRIPGKDNELLLSYLKQIFKLESIEPYEIQKEDNKEYPTITVNTSSAPPIVIKLDKARNNVVVMSTADNGQYKELQYDVHHLGREMVVGNRLPSEESIKHMVNDAEKQIEQLIYEFVYDLASSATDSERGNEFLYYCKILSRDHKFMRVVEEIYENRHKGFEHGCDILRKCNVKR